MVKLLIEECEILRFDLPLPFKEVVWNQDTKNELNK